VSEDKRFYIAAYLKRGFINVAIKDGREEKEVEFDNYWVNDGSSHTLEIVSESNNFLNINIDRRVSHRLEIASYIYLNSYTLGYYNQEFPSR
jgi:hypothetical protein